MDIKQITINGVTYEVSENHYKGIMAHIDNARVVHGAAQTATAPVDKQQLTPAALKDLFGENYKYVCVYDNEKRELLTKKYHGVEVYWDNDDTENSEKLKEAFDKGYPNFEQVGQATKQVSDIDYPGWGKWTYAGKQVKFDKNGTYTVGTLIIRNKQTGTLKLLKGTAWFGVSDRVHPLYAARNGAYWFPYCAAGDSDFRAKLFAGCNIKSR